MKLSSSLFIIVLFLRIILDKCKYNINMPGNAIYVVGFFFLLFILFFFFKCVSLLFCSKELSSFFGIFVGFVWGGRVWFGLFLKAI